MPGFRPKPNAIEALFGRRTRGDRRDPFPAAAGAPGL